MKNWFTIQLSANIIDEDSNKKKQIFSLINPCTQVMHCIVDAKITVTVLRLEQKEVKKYLMIGLSLL